MLCDGAVHPAEKRMLRHYRRTHDVDPAEHKQMVCSLGWSTAEYEDGAQDHVHDVVPALRAAQERVAATAKAGSTATSAAVGVRISAPAGAADASPSGDHRGVGL